MDDVVYGVVDLIPRLLKNRIQNHKTSSRLQYTVRFAHNPFRRSAKVVEGEGHEGAVKDLGRKRQCLGDTNDLEIAVEQRILDFFPADAEHRCRCVNTGYHTRRKALGYAAGKAACACRDFKNGFASAEFEKISQLLGQLHPEVRLGGHPIIFARMVVIMKSGGTLLLHHRPILRGNFHIG